MQGFQITCTHFLNLLHLSAVKMLLYQILRKCFEQKKCCSAVFLDIAQAFDEVWHEGLMYKIKRTFPGNTHYILQSYLTDRKF